MSIIMKNNQQKRMHYLCRISIAFVFLIFLGKGDCVFASTSKSNINDTSISNQSTITVKGVILDEGGIPVIGASVLEKDTQNGAISDLDGKFTITTSPDAFLVISYLGYKTQTVQAKPELQIILQEDLQTLDEVVVIGYGVQKKKLVTGATVQVKGDDVAKHNSSSIMGSLQTQAPGVNITQMSGFIGAEPKVNIRGIGTNGASSPLYIIDGVAGGDISTISPNDIESIDVLKDAASAAIYGARAANGVILVTTKKGKSGQFRVSYDGYYGVQNLYKIPTILNAEQYMAMQDEAAVMDGKDPYVWGDFIPSLDLAAINNGTWKGTNWLKEVLNEDAVTQSHSVNFSGGTDRSVFSMGLTYLNQEATIGVPGDAPVMDRFNFRMNSDHVIIKKNDFDLLKVGESINYRFQELEGNVPRDDIYWNIVRDAIKTSPLMHAYNSAGDYYTYADRKLDGYSWDISGGGDRNPIAYMDYAANRNKTRSHFLNSSLYLDLQPIKNLHIKSQFGFRVGFSSYRAYVPAYGQLTETLTQYEDRVSQSMSNFHRWTWDNTVSYAFNLNEEHDFSVLLGQSAEKWGMGESLAGSNLGSSFYDFEHAYLSNVNSLAKVQSLTGAPQTPGSMASFFGRINYDYREKYMATLIMRADGSSTFARGNRWGYFPSVSAGWVITNEDFMEGVSSNIDFLKLRGSYGQNGNSQVSGFQYMAPINMNNNYGGYPFGGSMGDASIGAYPYRLTNRDLKWETQTQLDVGVDMLFLRSRLGVELDWYTRTTKDWLVAPPILGSLGADAAYINGGDVKNKGFEVAVRWNDTVKDWTYGVSVNMSNNKNEVLKIANEEGVINGARNVLWWGAEPFYRAQVGEAFGAFYGYKADGIFQNQEQINNYKGPLLLGKDTRPGDVIWVDTDGNGELDANDRTIIGNPHPDITLGVNFNVEWKGIDLSMNLYGAFGHQILKNYRDYSIAPYNNFTSDVYERWHGENTSNKMPRLSSSSHTNWSRISSIYIEDADFLKIKNLTIGYDLKQAFKKLPLQRLRLYVTGQNLFTFTGYSGMDPEIGYGAGDSWASGIDLGNYPSSRIYMIGANIQF